jgi:hypothetical protein
MIDPAPVPDWTNPREAIAFCVGLVTGLLFATLTWLVSTVMARVLLADWRL